MAMEKLKNKVDEGLMQQKNVDVKEVSRTKVVGLRTNADSGATKLSDSRASLFSTISKHTMTTVPEALKSRDGKLKVIGIDEKQALANSIIIPNTPGSGLGVETTLTVSDIEEKKRPRQPRESKPQQASKNPKKKNDEGLMQQKNVDVKEVSRTKVVGLRTNVNSGATKLSDSRANLFSTISKHTMTTVPEALKGRGGKLKVIGIEEKPEREDSTTVSDDGTTYSRITLDVAVSLGKNK